MKIGFIGAGNMAQAIIKGVLAHKLVPATDIGLTASRSERATAVAEELGLTAYGTNLELAQTVDVLVLAVKPVVVPQVLTELAPVYQTGTPPLLVSIAAGLSLNWLQTSLPANNALEIIRVMPNMNATIQRSVSAMCATPNTSASNVAFVTELFSAIGTVYPLDEKDLANFTALAGCSPAFTYLYIDSLSRAGVKHGLPKALATKIAAEAVQGSAEMVLASTSETPWDLIDKVCSPGGTTIAGVTALADEAFMSSIIKACDATIARDQEIGGK